MKKINKQQLKQLIEAAIFVSDAPLSIERMKLSVLAEFSVSDAAIKRAIDDLVLDYQPRGIQLIEVASGFRFQSADSLSPWISRLWQESSPRYSRAMLETLALIAYRQPITRGEIEQVRGVAVSSNIIKTLTEREWVRVVGHKEVPGRPALYATTKQFLDYFSLKSLSELPSTDAFAQLAEQAPDSTKVVTVLSDDASQPDEDSTKEQLH